MKKYKLFILAAAFATFVMGCQDLEVENLNAPDRATLLSNPSEFPASINGAYTSFWRAIQLSQPNMPVSVMAQGSSMSWGNWGARDMGTIPRQALQNNLTYSNRGTWRNPWNGLYATLGPLNSILKILADDPTIVITDGTGADITNQSVANAKAVQGLALGYLSLQFDQAYIVDENADPSALVFSSYGDVNDAAIVKLEEAIALFSGSSLVMDGWFGLTFTGDDAADILRGFVAKFEMTQARNAGEAAAVDWNKVLTNATSATVGLSPVGDAGFNWWHRMLIQGQDGGWMRVSQKVIKLMNPTKPATEVPYPWPDGVNGFPDIVTPDDNRVTTDFTYNQGNDFSAARGYYFFGNYNYSRYESYRSGFTDPMDFLTTNEIDLMQAEALIRTGGSKATAAGLINQTRVTRGGLTALTGAESDADLLNAITYERIVEYTWHGSMNVWFFRRMVTPAGNSDATNLYYLEPNTARHFAVPADELSIFGLPFYTFGGNQGEQ